ncbi:MAG TPA: FlgD immunoglobulin-like domain containing protein [Candidatus Eisenbacteria bacterium]|nr:FlgD immunoglobulin-like domain containing protein [Candidatus Eisenbacteria bacterium]
MQFRMKALLVTLLFGLAGAAEFMLSTASADVVVRSRMEQELRVRAAKLRPRTSAGSDPDTVWIGHVNTVQPGVPGTPGGYGPFKIGRGPHRLTNGALGSATDFNGTWDFDHFQGGETDSLMGWWPIQAPFGSVGPTNFDDNIRPWFSLDYGNQGNYVIPQGSPKRTFGVIGYWHRDVGSASSPLPAGDAVPGPNPEWTPIAGTASAWCGLRSEGDNSVIDPITGNPINGLLVSFQGNNSGRQISAQRSQGTDNNFPGYGSQWDQMLYRDVAFGANASGNVTVTFKYTTNMSTGSQGDHASQAGWFDKDPLKTPVIGDGNYRSRNLANLVDSFMVYVGAPVDEANCLRSDGSIAPVYDLQRRWFSEVVKINAPGTSYRELVSVAGSQGTPAAPITANIVLTQAQVNSILDADGGAGNGGRLRLVFRVKTNRGSDDENQGNTPNEGTNNAAGGFSSLTRGAAIIDDVSVSGGGATALTNGFESVNDVDNNTGVAATLAWKSTGKPPGAWFHTHRINEPGSPLPFEDPCGAVTAAVRFCNATGAVLSPGNHDDADKTGGLYGGNTQDQQKYIVSPTINLKSNGVGDYNGMGIDAEIANRVPQLWGEYLHNVYNYDLTANGFRFGWQSWPATQANGQKVWGCMVKSIFFSSWSDRGCYEELLVDPLVDQLVVTSNPSGVPDSFRVYIESMSRCYSLQGTVTALACSPTSGANAGGYFDNLAIAFVTAPPPPALAATFSNQFQDCFPVNSQNKPVNTFGVGYDTLAARLQTGYNVAPQTGSSSVTGNNARENISGDSALAGGAGANVRMDLVFRILPGPGNYVTIGNRSSGIARRPDQAPRVAASAGDVGAAIPSASKFWGAYIADNGGFGTGGNGATGPGHAGAVGNWDWNKWNSARMDTVETNFFPTSLLDPTASTNLTPGVWMTMYHESDPKYATLGINKNRCFINTGAQSNKADNINCGNLGGGNPYPPSAYAVGGVPVAGSGLPASENGLAIGHTFEYTKILPDGIFTPGTEIQYFYRKSILGDPVSQFEMSPDTNYIFPQNTETFGYFDFHRWREVRVLPDRWKDGAWGTGGQGMACMLVLDLGERRGDLGIWIATADSMGMTASTKRGAHNGWRARPDQDWAGVNVGSDDSICRRDNGGQPGTIFDVYSTIAGESNIPSGRPGSRGANRNTAGGSLTTGKWSTHGPSEDMVKNYRMLVLLAADIGDQALGPIPDQTDADIGLFQSFLSLPGGSAQPRGFIAQGMRLGELMSVYHGTFMSSFLRATLRNGDYRLFSGNASNVADVIVQPPVTSGGSPYTFGLSSFCFINNDVFNVQVAAPAGQVGAYHENVGAGAPYVASVYAPASGGARPFKTLYNGWTMGLFGGMGTETSLLNVGTRKYFYDALTSAFGDLLCTPSGSPVGVGDGNGTGKTFVNFMNLKSSNPMRSGEARIAFGLEKTERIQLRVFDVTGRLVKTVADRTFQAGQQHVVVWDGTNDAGQKVSHGVYFYQLKSNSWTSQKKLAVLAN